MERFNILISNDLSRAIAQAAEETEQTKSDILRKALTMFFAARDGVKQGHKLGLFDPETRQVQTEFVGL